MDDNIAQEVERSRYEYDLRVLRTWSIIDSLVPVGYLLLLVISAFSDYFWVYLNTGLCILAPFAIVSFLIQLFRKSSDQCRKERMLAYELKHDLPFSDSRRRLAKLIEDMDNSSKSNK